MYRFLLAALALCTLPASARAQDVLTEVSPKKMTKSLTSMGLEVEEAKSKDGEQPPLKFDLGGYRVLLFLANKNTDAQLFIGFGEQQISTDKTNEWNSKHRFAPPTGTRTAMRYSNRTSISPAA